MNHARNDLKDLRVADLMCRNVVTVSANSTMSEAADTLTERQVNGAPVIDVQGRCVGVLSGTDFIHGKAEELPGDSPVTHVLTSRPTSGLYRIEEVLHDLVRRHMSPAVQTIDESCSLIEAARCMCDEHIHRLIVLDDGNRPVGVLTSLDVMSQLVKALDE